jgi:hypothetical protein
MTKRLYFVVFLSAVLFASVVAAQQYPLMNMIADRVIQKYQQASCAELWKHKGAKKTDEEKNLIQLLKDDPQMRTAFIDKVAAPIANKMFECDMLP